jgi:hypothetical protein
MTLRILLYGESTKNKVRRNLIAKRICLLQKEKTGGERNWDRTDMKTGKNQTSPVITMYMFFHLLALFEEWCMNSWAFAK